jgi:hypothetical protein
MLGSTCFPCCKAKKTCDELKALDSVSATVTASDFFAYRTVRNSSGQLRSESMYFPGSLYSGSYSLSLQPSGGFFPTYDWKYTFTQTGLMCNARTITFSVADDIGGKCRVTMAMTVDWFLACNDVPPSYRTASDFTCSMIQGSVSLGSTITGLSSFDTQTYSYTFSPTYCSGLSTDTTVSSSTSGSGLLSVTFSAV